VSARWRWNRNLAYAHPSISWAKSLLGRSAETEAHIHEALHLSPRDIYDFLWMNGIGIAKSQMGADAEAVAWLRRSIEANPNQSMSRFFLAATLARLGNMDEARAAGREGLRAIKASPSAASAPTYGAIIRLILPGASA
jgi:tetratricopeptide (TPR) repeat protein